MNTLPCRKCGHQLSHQPPRCPQCGIERPISTYGPAQEAKSQALVFLFGLAVCAGVAALTFFLWG
jgi:primosomal protein N'